MRQLRILKAKLLVSLYVIYKFLTGDLRSKDLPIFILTGYASNKRVVLIAAVTQNAVTFDKVTKTVKYDSTGVKKIFYQEH